jgi:hypothetical protein
MSSAIKSTYSLDAPSVVTLNRLARQWQVSKTEVLRRALRQASQQESISPAERIAALRELQRSVAEKRIDLKKWQRTVKDGRH